MTTRPVTAEPPGKVRERALQRIVKLYIATGLLFMLLPGTFLGVWNLISISGHHSAHALSPAWIQAHGHAQVFGWIGTFIIGIGFYSLSKMGELRAFVIGRAWAAWVLWTIGVTGRWASGVYGWHWRILLPVSACLECAGYLLFFTTVRQHKTRAKSDLPVISTRPEGWMRLVIASTFCFLGALLWNLAASVYVAIRGLEPALPKSADQHLLAISVWGVLVLSVWGFNARWLPMFAGLKKPGDRELTAALYALLAGLLLGFLNFGLLSIVVLLFASGLSVWALHVFEPAVQPAKTQGIHPAFPYFVRGAYVWLLIAACLGIWGALADRNGGITGASRHALTVGFIGTMVFSIGPRVLPAFCGGHILFSKRLMLGALALLNAGCFLRVTSEIPAYEGLAAFAWNVLPVSAIIELSAVALFAVNLLATFLRAPAGQPAMRKAA